MPPVVAAGGKGKGGKGGRGGKGGKSTSRSAKAGLQFPVGRVARFLKKGINHCYYITHHYYYIIT